MKRELKQPRHIRIDAVVDRKIQRVAAHAGTPYIAALEWLADVGYRYYVEQHPEMLDGVFGRRPSPDNIKPLLK